MARSLLMIVALVAMLGATQAAERRGMRFWNLTLYTLTSLQFSAPGQNAWGKNQCENDNDKTVDHDERLRITGVESGTYDAKLTDVSGRTCLVRNIKVETGQIFSIEEKELTSCTMAKKQ